MRRCLSLTTKSTDSGSQLSFPGPFEIQTLRRPKLQLQGPLVVLLMCSGFFLFFFLKHGINRVLYCGLCIITVGAPLKDNLIPDAAKSAATSFMTRLASGRLANIENKSLIRADHQGLS